MNNPLVGIAEAAKMLNVHEQTLRKWDDAGILKSIRAKNKNKQGHRKYLLSDIEKRREEMEWKPKIIVAQQNLEILPNKLFLDTSIVWPIDATLVSNMHLREVIYEKNYNEILPYIDGTRLIFVNQDTSERAKIALRYLARSVSINDYAIDNEKIHFSLSNIIYNLCPILNPPVNYWNYRTWGAIPDQIVGEEIHEDGDGFILKPSVYNRLH